MDFRQTLLQIYDDLKTKDASIELAHHEFITQMVELIGFSLGEWGNWQPNVVDSDFYVNLA